MTQTTTAKPIKVYIGVEADFGSDGVMMPRAIIWKDETRYEVDRVLDIRPAPALKAGARVIVILCGSTGKQPMFFLSVALTSPGML